jgi:hypothetical protein
MPQLPAGVLYGFPRSWPARSGLTMAEQMPGDAGWAGFATGLLGTAGVMLMVFGVRQIRPGWRLCTLFGSGGFLELIGEHFLDGMLVLAWLAWMAGVLFLTVGWLVAARDVWRLARPR